MTLKLVLLSQANCDATEFFLREGSCRVGRMPDNDFRIEEPCVSGYHAEVHWTSDGSLEVTDLDSSNGTFLNEEHISAPVKIQAGDVLEFGSVRVAIEEHRETLPAAMESPEPVEGIIRFDEVPLIEEEGPGSTPCEVVEAEEDHRETLDELTAAKDAAEKEVQRLSGELSRLREESSGGKADDGEDLSFQISELEYSLETEKLLTDAIKEKNEQFRTKIEYLTLDLGNAQEEISRLKASHARRFSLPDDFSKEGAEFARLKKELARSHEENADLQEGLTKLQTELAGLKGELAKHEIEQLEKEKSEAEHSREKELEKEIDALKARLSESESLSETLVDEKIDLNRTCEELKVQLEAAGKAAEQEESIRQSNSELKEKLKEAENRASDLEARMEKGASSDSRNAALVRDLKKQLKEAESRSGAGADLEDELDSAREKQLAAEAEVEELKEKLASVEAEADQLKDELKDAESQSRTGGELEDELDSTRKKQLAAEAEVEELKEKLASVEAEADQLKDELKDAESQSRTSGELEDKLESIGEEKRAAEAEVEELKGKLASVEEEAQQLKEQLDLSQDQCSDLDVLVLAKTNLASDQADTIDQLRKDLAETRRDFAASRKQLVKTHQGELKALQNELKLSRKESDREKRELRQELRQEVAQAQSDLASLKETHEKERTRQTREQEKRISQLEEELAEMMDLRSETESARDELMDQLGERDERIAELTELTGDLESRIGEVESEKSDLASDLRFTREGLSDALHSAQSSLARATRELEAEVARRAKVETLLQKSEAARKGLRSEIEALEAGLDEGVVLAPEDTGLHRIGELLEGGVEGEDEEKSEELRAFEERLASLRPNHGPSSGDRRGFGEVEFYRELVEKLDLIDDLIRRHENKWRYAKIVKQLVLLKESFRELLQNQSVDPLELAPGTPLCNNQSHRLKLAPLEDGSEPKIDPFGKTEVIETVSPGYIFHDGSRDLVIRKATVRVE